MIPWDMKLLAVVVPLAARNFAVHRRPVWILLLLVAYVGRAILFCCGLG